MQDLKGNEVVPGSLPGVGTKLIVNGNVFRIVYTKKNPNFSFSAEFIGKHEPETDSNTPDNWTD